MAITKSMVKELRSKTGSGIMDCKRALVETNGDSDRAKNWLRTKGLAAAARKADRVAVEGLTSVVVDGLKGTAIEINSETDFVARNELFQSFVKKCSDLVLTHKSDIDALKALPFPDTGRSVDQELSNNIATIGENMNIRRVEYLEVSEGVLVSYIHNKITEDLGKLGVIVAIESHAKQSQLLEVGKQIAMHIAATSPKSINIEDLDSDLVNREREVLIDQAMSSGKPKEIAEKMVQGRLQKFFQEVVLNEQTSVIDGETKIKDIIKNLSNDLGTDVRIKDFKILKLGEGIEVTENNFAAEVAATAGIK